jgi:O-antigen/teichoic acid export membrane protein
MSSTSSEHLQTDRRTIVHNIAYLFSGSALTQVLTALALLLTARKIGPEGYGQYAACMVLITFASITFSLGTNLWFLHEAGRQPTQIRELLGSVLVLKIILAIPWYLAIFAVTGLFDSSSFPKDLLRLTSLVVVLDSLLATLLTAFKAALRNQITSIITVIGGILWLTATVWLAASHHGQTVDYMRLRGVTVFITLLGAAILTWRWFRPKPQVHLIKQALREALPYGASELLVLSSLRIDILIVALMLGEQAAGLYAPAVGLVNALFLPLSAISGVMIPVLSHLFAVKNTVAYSPQQAWSAARRMTQLQLALGGGLSLMLFFGARLLVAILGARFGGSQEVLQILSIILFIHAIVLAASNVLIASHQQSKRTLVQAAAVILNIVLNFLVVGWAGIRGVAVVYVITEIVMAIGLCVPVLQYYAKNRAGGLPGA